MRWRNLIGGINRWVRERKGRADGGENSAVACGLALSPRVGGKGFVVRPSASRAWISPRIIFSDPSPRSIIDVYARRGGFHFFAQGRRGRASTANRSAGASLEHHAVIVACRGGRDFALDHVALNEFRLALQRVAPAAAAGGHDADNLPGPHRFAVDQAAEIVGGRGVDGHAERRPGLAAVEAVAAEPHAVGGDDGAAIDQRAVMLVVAEPAAAFAGAAGIGAQRELLNQQREARLGELGRLVPRVRTMWMASLPSA